MKFIQKILLRISICLMLVFNMEAMIHAQPPPPPAGHGESGNQPAGNGAPIGSGLFILLGLGAAYGGKKVYDYRKEHIKQ